MQKTSIINLKKRAARWRGKRPSAGSLDPIEREDHIVFSGWCTLLAEVDSNNGCHNCKDICTTDTQTVQLRCRVWTQEKQLPKDIAYDYSLVRGNFINKRRAYIITANIKIQNCTAVCWIFLQNYQLSLWSLFFAKASYQAKSPTTTNTDPTMICTRMKMYFRGLSLWLVMKRNVICKMATPRQHSDPIKIKNLRNLPHKLLLTLMVGFVTWCCERWCSGEERVTRRLTIIFQ